MLMDRVRSIEVFCFMKKKTSYETRSSAKGYRRIGLPSGAKTILLDLWPMAEYIERNRTTKFPSEVLPTGR